MSFIANVPFSAKISALSLEQYLNQQENKPKLPIGFMLNTETLTLNEKCKLGPTELVVFHDITLQQLLDLQTHAQIKITDLKTINSRNKQTSCRFSVSCSDYIQARKAVAQFSLENGVEAALLINAPTLNEPGLLVMDMDSTTIEIECIDEIAKLAGVGEQVATVTERAMLGELDFAQSLHERVATLKDSPEKILADVAKNIPLMAGLENLIIELKKHNWRIAIASGGFTYFSDHLKEQLNLDAAFANTLDAALCTS